MNKNLTLSLLALLGLMAVQPAQAATVSTVSLGSGLSYAIGGPVLTSNVNLQSIRANEDLYANYRVSGIRLEVRNAAIVTGNDTDGWFQHIRPASVGRNEHYLSVFGAEPWARQGGTATFELNGKYNSFSFDWGSVDRYNTVSFIDGNDVKHTITGSDIIRNALDHVTVGKTSEYVSLFSLSGIKKVIFASTRDAFEIGDIRVANVPLPAALPMFGAALFGLGALRRRKKA